MATLSELISTFERLWPLAGAEGWDAPGLVTGDANAQVKRVLLSVDVTADLIAEAIGDFDLVLSHHPYLMRGVTSIAQTNAKGSVLSTAIRNDLAIYAAHTNADIVSHGVSAAMASTLGLVDALPLVPSASDPKIGHGRIGRLAQPMLLGEFARHIAKTLPATATGVRVAGAYAQQVSLVALCGGAGDSFIDAAVAANADVYVTSDLRHHVVQETREAASLNGFQPALVDVSHWAAEWLWLEVAAEQLRALHPNLEFVVSDLRTDPFDFVITQ